MTFYDFVMLCIWCLSVIYYIAYNEGQLGSFIIIIIIIIIKMFMV